MMKVGSNASKDETKKAVRGKGFHSKDNVTELNKRLDHVILPKERATQQHRKSVSFWAGTRNQPTNSSEAPPQI